MHKNRLFKIKEGLINKDKQYVLYWMQQSQRVHYNHALNHAIELANHFELPLVVYFGLDDTYPDANLRSYWFMLEGLNETKQLLNKLGISFVLRFGKPQEAIIPLLKGAQAFVMDRGYLKHQRTWRKELYQLIKSYDDLYIDMVDTDLIVPVDQPMDKAAYGAYVLRPKLKKLIEDYRDFKKLLVVKHQQRLNISSDDDLSDLNQTIHRLNVDETIGISPLFKGGYQQASHMFSDFVMHKINSYPMSNDPSLNLTSYMSMYLHFGQISSLELFERLHLALEQGQIDGNAFDQYVEQLIVRRELAFNYVWFQQGYDRFELMTEPWAYETMKIHNNDPRTYLYTKDDYLMFQTHDPYFNAAMKEMVLTGYMHNYMRMYWAKKIIEWSDSFEYAYETIMSLNNTYFIDGRDANSYAGVAWCFGKHDRAWTERHIFGKLRYMNDKGLERKFDIKAYVERIDGIEKALQK